MRYLDLRPGVSFACIDGDLIFLDLDHDRYLAMRGQAAEGFRQILERPCEPLSQEVLDQLLATGLLTRSAAPILLSAAPEWIPERSLIDEAAPAVLPHLPTLLEVMAVLWTVKRAVGRRQLPERLERLARLKASARRSSTPGDVDRTALRFASARSLAPFAPNCLSDSLALAEFLLRRSAIVDIVFGVKLAPFAAHAWVQTEETILNDHLDYVREFTPVLVA